MTNIEKLANFIENSKNGLLQEVATNYRYKLDDRLAVFVGWSGGYGDTYFGDLVQDKGNPDYAINVGLKVWTSDDLWCDFDWVNYPYYDSGIVLDFGFAISPQEDFKQLAKEILKYYRKIKYLKINKNGLIVEE